LPVCHRKRHYCGCGAAVWVCWVQAGRLHKCSSLRQPPPPPTVCCVPRAPCRPDILQRHSAALASAPLRDADLAALPPTASSPGHARKGKSGDRDSGGGDGGDGDSGDVGRPRKASFMFRMKTFLGRHGRDEQGGGAARRGSAPSGPSEAAPTPSTAAAAAPGASTAPLPRTPYNSPVMASCVPSPKGGGRPAGLPPSPGAVGSKAEGCSGGDAREDADGPPAPDPAVDPRVPRRRFLPRHAPRIYVGVAGSRGTTLEHPTGTCTRAGAAPVGSRCPLPRGCAADCTHAGA
jgi:hypothetical protein